jgi:pyrroline-5-carboxylate reductase
VAGSEQELRTLGCVSGFMSTYFELQQVLVRWLEDSDVPRSHASLYVRSMLAGLADTARRSPEELQGELPRHHETRGGLNERVRRHLRERRWFEEPARAFDVLKELSRSSLG